MSVIAVRKYKDRIEIASDSQTTSGDRKDLNAIKILNFDGVIVGHAGSVAFRDVFGYFYEYVYGSKFTKTQDIIPFFIAFGTYLKEHNIDMKLDNSSFVFIIKNSICIFYSFALKNIENYGVIGAGGDWALAGLDMGLSPKEAVKLAIKRDLYCGGAVKNKVIKIAK